MPTTVFVARERQYRAWLNKNRAGFVLTTLRSTPPTYMSLHRADCGKIRSYTSAMSPGAFTERKYIKVCALDRQSLLTWIKTKGGKGFTSECSRCQPWSSTKSKKSVSAKADALMDYQASLDAEVSRSREDRAGRRKRLKLAAKKPSAKPVQTIVYIRNPDVIAEVSERAAGNCERCKKAAPFKRQSDHSPYLEVHHKVRLADGGDDTVKNALALCPNCHREAHFGKQATI